MRVNIYKHAELSGQYRAQEIVTFYNPIFKFVHSKQYFEKEIQNSISKTRCVHAIIMLDGENNTINDIINSAAISSITYNFNQLTQDVLTYGY